MKFQTVNQAVVDFLKDEEGASAIEYVLIAAMVAVALVTFVTPIKTAVTSIFTEIQSALTSASGGGS